MALGDLLSPLETWNSEVVVRNLFKKRRTMYMPDITFVFFYITLYVSSAVLDRLYDALLIIEGPFFFTLGLMIIPSHLAYLFFLTTMEKIRNACFPDFKKSIWFKISFHAISALLGLDAFFLGGTALKNIPKEDNTSLNYRIFFHKFFHITNRDLAHIRIYCLVNSAFKTLPQLFTVATFLLTIKDAKFCTLLVAIATTISKALIFYENQNLRAEARSIRDVCDLNIFLSKISILLNITLFSLSIAITFPIRKTPRIFRTSFYLFFSSLCKFMAAMSSWGMILTMYSMIFKNIGYYSLCVLLLRILVVIWPCISILVTIRMPKRFKMFHTFLLLVILSIIYIHPFQGRGKLFYYYVYLFSFLLEIASIYIFSEAEYSLFSVYFTFRLLVIGFGGCFGLTNVLHTVKPIIEIFINEPRSDSPPVKEVHKGKPAAHSTTQEKTGHSTTQEKTAHSTAQDKSAHSNAQDKSAPSPPHEKSPPSHSQESSPPSTTQERSPKTHNEGNEEN